MTSLRALADLIRQGRKAPDGTVRNAIGALFGDRYPKQAAGDIQVRDAYALARDESERGVPWAGIIHADNPPSGPYGGTSLVWFPGESGALLGLVIGTRGINPDEGILTRPGHRRRVAAMRRNLASRNVRVWAKADPTALGVPVPKAFSGALPEFAGAFKRYANEMYCMAVVPNEPDEAERVLQSFVDLYAYERGWSPLKEHKREVDAFLADLHQQLFRVPTIEEVATLVRQRRFVILMGAPGTGKTRLADLVRRDAFSGRGMTIQFHPSITYEDFVIGLSPDPVAGSLRFGVRAGALLQAAQRAQSGDFVLMIDEINRADLGKVMGEAIYLFEPGEVGGDNARSIRLPHPYGDESEFRLPQSLYLLGTMNSADRSIASLDLAIRRRFAFVRVPPDRSAIVRGAPPEALEWFDELARVFVEHASDDALDLLPGQSYFLAPDLRTFKLRVRHELIPLLDDYLRQGLLGSAGNELEAVRDRIGDSADT